MSYKAFVSSTYEDLKDHRAHVIRELRKAGFEVDPMEDWTSSADQPKQFSRERLEGCHLCVLLVARRRGHLPSGEQQSITQMEFEEAKRRGIDVLPFLLDDSVDEDKWPWEEKEIVQAWRAELFEHYGVQTFKRTPSTLKIGPALNRWVQEQGPKVALRLYLESVKQHHGYIKFLGLPRLEDIQDAPIQRLFVEPAVADRPVSPDIDPKEWPQTKPLREALAEYPRLVLLGDPGSGKSTLVDWLAWQLAEQGTSRLPSGTLDEQIPSVPDPSRPARQAGYTSHNLVPLPMILRDLRIGAGITWETLLQKFVDTPLGKLLTLTNLERILADGRAMIMLDGLDEIGDPQVRRDLRDAVWKGMLNYDLCRWLVTSRIVSYHDMPFDLAMVAPNDIPDFDEYDWASSGRSYGDSGSLEDVEFSIATVNYVGPFDDLRVDQFANNWFVLREKTTHKAKRGANDLLKAIRGDEATKKLGRIPNLLTMMALIYRVRARLPHGRALLYNEIAQAYLETIDFFRQIATRTEPLADKKRWLARVGFEMQRQRSSPTLRVGTETQNPDSESRATEIFASGDEVRRWIAAAMGESLQQRSAEDAAEFVDYLGRRAGLLLPRGRDHFAFMHLSFQEYFAACFLQNQIASPDWLLDDDGIAPGAGKEDLRGYARKTVWRETLVFLIELLAASDQPKWLRPARQALFGQDYADVRDGEHSAWRQAGLLARLAVDPHAAFADDQRWRAVEVCCRWDARAQKKQENETYLLQYDNEVLRTLLATESNAEARRILGELAACAQSLDLRSLDLSDTLVSDLSPLTGLKGLQSLRLHGTPVSDLTPISGLTSLVDLRLHSTSVSDLTPISGLVSLQKLYLADTAVSDATPLSQMMSLQDLGLSRTQVSDLTSLAGLLNLQRLGLNETSVSDLTSLAGLAKLRVVNVRGTPVSDEQVAAFQEARERAGFKRVRIVR